MDNRQIFSAIVVQILGFFAVFFILKSLAWTKLLGAIDARRQKIADEFEKIESQKKGLADLEREYRLKLEHIDQEARAKIHEAASTGLALAKELQEKARQESKLMIERARAEIEQDLAKAKLQYRDQIVEISGLMAEKVLREKIDAREHAKLVDQFIQDLEKIS